MKITKVTTFRVREPQSKRGYSVVKVESDAGLTGWGEGPLAEAAVVSALPSLLVGQDPRAYEPLALRLGSATLAGAANMALLDICGKAAKAPVFQLLGGPTRNKVRVYATLPNGEPQLQAALAAGHRAFSLPVRKPEGIVSRPNFVGAAVQRFTALRKSLPDTVDFVADGEAGLQSAEATDLAVALEPLHPLFFDEPCASSAADVMQRISEECATPIGMGRRATQLGEVQNMLRDGTVDLVRLSLAQHGISQIRRAAALAETYYVAVAPHHVGGPIATAAGLHLAASLPNFFIQQVPWVEAAEDRKLRDELVGEAIEQVRDGYLALSTRVGLGINVNESVLARMAE